MGSLGSIIDRRATVARRWCATVRHFSSHTTRQLSHAHSIQFACRSPHRMLEETRGTPRRLMTLLCWVSLKPLLKPLYSSKENLQAKSSAYYGAKSYTRM